MHLEHLLYFIEVAKCTSLNQAAGNLFISQPTLRAAIQSLERDFNTKLIISNHRGFTLTTSGEILAEEAAEIKRHLESCQRRINQLENQGDINIASINASVPLFFVDLTATIHEAYPDIKVQITPANAEQCIDLLNDGKITFAIISAQEKMLDRFLSRLRSSKYTIHLLFRDEFLCYMNNENPLSKYDFVTLKDLASYTFLVPDEKTMFIESSAMPKTAQFSQKINCFSPVSALRMISNSKDSFAFLSKIFLLDKNSLPSNICARPIEDNKLFTNHYLIAPAEEILNEKEIFAKSKIIDLYIENIRNRV